VAGRQAAPQVLHPHLRCVTRHSLLLGTALASTLLLATMTAPTPAHAVVTCPPGTFPPPGPITLNPAGDSVNCVNIFDRNNAAAPVIDLQTYGAGRFISLNNSENLTSPDDRGIRAYSHNPNSPVDVFNTGDIDSFRTGIYAKVRYGALNVFNAGHITTEYLGIQAATGTGGGPNSPLSLINTGDIDLQQGTAISANTYQAQSELSVVNSGALTGANYAIFASTGADDSPLSVTNSGDLRTTSDPANFNFRSYGIGADIGGANSPLTIHNSGDILATANSAQFATAYGIRVYASNTANSAISIVNSGNIHTKASSGAYSASFGINVISLGNSPTTINNSGSVYAE